MATLLKRPVVVGALLLLLVMVPYRWILFFTSGADFYNNRIQVFSAAGRLPGQFGDTGPDPLDRPTDVIVAADGTIYVVDFGHNHIAVFG